MKITDLFKKQVETTDQDLVDQIHNEFDTAPQRLLEQALSIIDQESNSKIVLESGIEDKASRLEKLGFIKNGLIAKKQEILKRNESKDKVINMQTAQANDISYYSKTYPFIKFLSEEELDRICDKYGLIYAPVKHYKMPVPDKNLEEIENAQSLKVEDERKNEVYWEYVRSDNRYEKAYKEAVEFLGGNKFTVSEIEQFYDKYPLKNKTPNVLSFSGLGLGGFGLDTISYETALSDYDYLNLFWNIGKHLGINLICDGVRTEIDKQGLFIAAPKHHFDLEGLEFDEKKGYFQVTKKVVKDPVVFRYVRGGIAVLTKWGLEGEDPALQMEILN